MMLMLFTNNSDSDMITQKAHLKYILEDILYFRVSTLLETQDCTMKQ